MDQLMNNKIITASQNINGKEQQLPIIDNAINDTTIQNKTKNDHVKSKSSAKSVLYFELKNNNTPVKLTAHYNNGKIIGSEVLKLNTLKIINIVPNNQNNDQITNNTSSQFPSNNSNNQNINNEIVEKTTYDSSSQNKVNINEPSKMDHQQLDPQNNNSQYTQTFIMPNYQMELL